jgi:chemotaxis protein MotA
MFIIIGIVVVFGAVVGGFLMEHGNLRVLMQPVELVTIGAAALGTVLVANPLYIVKKIVGGVAGAFAGSKFSKQRYLETLKMMFELFSRARRDGLMALETDSDNPEQSAIFSKYPNFLEDHHALAFVCDSIRMASSGGIEPFDADQMIENDMDVHYQQATMPIAALSTVADSLPDLGIVAAVLGVVITMGSWGGPPEEIGKKVAAALVGTFLGILLCYGLVGPLAANMSKTVDDEHAYYQVLRVMIVAFMKGTAPTMAVEIGRRAIPGNVRPPLQEAEVYIKDKSGAPVAVAA